MDDNSFILNSLQYPYLWRTIFSFLSHDDLVSLSKVCKGTRNIFADPLIEEPWIKSIPPIQALDFYGKSISFRKKFWRNKTYSMFFQEKIRSAYSEVWFHALPLTEIFVPEFDPNALIAGVPRLCDMLNHLSKRYYWDGLSSKEIEEAQIKFLLDLGADPNQKYIDGHQETSALFIRSCHSDDRVLQLLLDYGLDIHQRVGPNQKNILCMWHSFSNPNTLKFFTDSNLDRNKCMLIDHHEVSFSDIKNVTNKKDLGHKFPFQSKLAIQEEILGGELARVFFFYDYFGSSKV